MKRDLPSAESLIYMNTGAASPLPRSVHETMQAEAEWELYNGRVGTKARERFFSDLSKLKKRLASLVNVEPGDLAIVESTTVGLNIAIWSLRLAPGDEILVARSEHTAAMAVLVSYRRRHGVTVRVYDDTNFQKDHIISLINKNTKAIVLSHVSWMTGRIHPVADICRHARALNVRTIIDGAQAFASISVDIKQIDPDWYIFPAQKWSFGPEGIAALFVNNAIDKNENQAFAGPFSFKTSIEIEKFEPSAGAAKYEIGTRYRATVCGWLAALDWLGLVGIDEIVTQSAMLRKDLRSMIRNADCNLLEETGDFSPLISIPVGSIDRAVVIAEELDKLNIRVRAIPGTDRIRVSTAFFLDQSDLDGFVIAYCQLSSGV